MTKQSQTPNDQEEENPKIIGFVCNWHSLGEVENFIDVNYQAKIKFIRVMCAARVDRAILLKAAENNIDGVMIIMCKENDCHYKDGSVKAKTRITHTASLLNSLGFNENRIKLIEIDESTENQKVSEIIKNFSLEIKSVKNA